MFKNPFSFSGRIRRTEYWFSLAITYGAIVLFGLLVQGMSDARTVLAFLLVPIYWFLFAQGAKRCHDRGSSGMYQFIPFYIVWLLLAEGEPGMNSYGEDPKASADGGDAV